MFPIFTSLFVYFGSVCFSFKSKAFINMFVEIGMYCYFFIYIGYYFSYWVCLQLLLSCCSFSVCEGALGLFILVSMIRSHANAFSNSFFIFMLKYVFIYNYFLIPLCLWNNCWWLVFL